MRFECRYWRSLGQRKQFPERSKRSVIGLIPSVAEPQPAARSQYRAGSIQGSVVPPQKYSDRCKSRSLKTAGRTLDFSRLFSLLLGGHDPNHWNSVRSKTMASQNLLAVVFQGHYGPIISKLASS